MTLGFEVNLLFNHVFASTTRCVRDETVLVLCALLEDSTRGHTGTNVNIKGGDAPHYSYLCVDVAADPVLPLLSMCVLHLTPPTRS